MGKLSFIERYKPRSLTFTEYLDEATRSEVRHGHLNLRRVRVADLLHEAGYAHRLPHVSDDYFTQAEYLARRLDGVSHNLAEMFALAQPPMSNTDREFMEGWCNGNQFEKQPWVGDHYKQEAEAAGVDITGKRYMGGLARFPGDPEAWVSGRGDVQRVCETRGWGCQGAVNVQAQQPIAAPAEVGLADDIVDGKVADILADLPAAERPHVDTQDLREQVKEAYTPHWSK